MEEGDPSAAIEEEPGSDVPQEAPEPPANVVDLETVPPVEPEAQAEEVRAEEKESTPSRKAGGLPEINGSRRKPPAHGAELTTPSPNLPSVGKQRSKIPSASPSRINRPSPGRSRIPVIAGSDGAPSLGRDASPGAGGWSMFTKNDSKPKPLIQVNGPSPEENMKRKMWAMDKRRREEAIARAEAERQQAIEARKREEEEMKLESRRAQIRERIQRQHEIAARAYYVSQAAEERAKAELMKFKGQKPLYEKLAENYSQLEKQQEEELKKKYEDEVGKYKRFNTRQLIAGDVVVKPPVSLKEREEKKEASIKASRKSPGRKPPAFIEKLQANGELDAIISSIGEDALSPHKPGPAASRRGAPPPLAPNSGGLVLYSRSTKPNNGAFVERAVSPFILDNGQPVNVPDQSMFWKKPKRGTQPEVLNVDSVPEGDGEEVDPGSPLPEGATVEGEEEAAGQAENAAEEEQAPEEEAEPGQEPEPEPEAEPAAAEEEPAPEPEPEAAEEEPVAPEAEPEAEEPEAAADEAEPEAAQEE